MAGIYEIIESEWPDQLLTNDRLQMQYKEKTCYVKHPLRSFEFSDV